MTRIAFWWAWNTLLVVVTGFAGYLAFTQGLTGFGPVTPGGQGVMIGLGFGAGITNILRMLEP